MSASTPRKPARASDAALHPAALHLRRGDLLPDLDGLGNALEPQASAVDLARYEAPGINTLVEGHTRLVLSEALGANVLDTAGRRYIDLVSGFGVALLGHRHPQVVQALQEQAGKLLHGLGDVYANPPRIQLARALCARAPFADAQVYFAVSGADAVEIALKTAVLATARERILAFDPGYHGMTLGALQVSSRPAFREPFAAHCGGHVTRLPFACDANDLRRTLSSGNFAAVLFEPVVGREGVLFPPPGWVAGLLEIARETETVSIADEIFTGFRRTGPWFAHCPEPDDPTADLICCGKALGGGLPLGVVLGKRSLFAAWDRGGEALHTGTFVAHPLACAAALAVLDELEQPWVTERLGAIERAFSALREAAAQPSTTSDPTILEVRGQGALWAIDCATDAVAKRLQKAALERGLLVLAGGPKAQVVQLVPPLSISDQQLEYVVETLGSLLTSLAPD